MLKLKSSHAVSCLFSLSFIPVSFVMAESAIDETVVVTANAGQSTTLLDAPATLTVIDVQEQSKYQFTGDVGDLLVDAPGVNVSTQANGSRSVRIRGLSSDYTQVLLNSRRSYTREALWRGSDNALSLTPSVAINNIEVIRGPMSTLYGADTMGGVVNVITRQHRGTAEGAVSVEAQYNPSDKGGNGQIYGLYFSTPVTDALSYTVYGNYLDTDESFYSDQSSFTKRRAQENYNLVNSFDYALNDQHTIDLEVQLSNEDQSGTAMYRGRSYEQERQLKSYTLGYDYQSYLVSVDAHLYYSDFDVKYDIPSSDITEQNYGGDAQAIFFIDDHTVTIGTEARNAEIENVRITGGSTDRTSTAAYIETNLAVADSTMLTLGGRFDHDSLFDSEFTYRGYITQGLTNNWNLKAGAGTAFKAPTMAQVSPSYNAPASGPACPGRPTACNIYGNQDLKAETGTFSEIGAYYANEETYANATVFYNRVDDIIQQVEKPNGSDGYYTFINVDKATLKGLELYAEHQFEHVGFDASYTYLDAIDDTSGDRLVGTSEHEASVKANWYVTYDTDLFARAHYRSEVRGELGNNDVSDPYTTFDIGMRHILMGELDLKLGVNNVMDEDISSPETYTEVIQGRTYYAGLNYAF